MQLLGVVTSRGKKEEAKVDVSSQKKYPVNMKFQENDCEHDHRKGYQRQLKLPKTVEEYRKVLQSEGDRRVTMALETAKAKWEQEYEQRIKKERAETTIAAQKSIEKREKAILDKVKVDREALEKVLNQTELKLKTIYLLNDRNLPITFVNFLLDQDEDKIERNVDDFQRAFYSAVEEAMKKMPKKNNSCNH